MSKLAKTFLRLFVIPARCFFLSEKVSEVDSFSFHRDSGFKFPIWMGSNPLVFGLGTNPFCPVHVALRGGDKPKVGLTIVKGVAVDVVNPEFLGGISHDKTVHCREFLIGAVGIRFSVSPHSGYPVKCRDFFEVIGIDNGIKPTCKRNQLDRMVLRLNDFVTLHDTHFLTSNEKSWPFSRIFSLSRQM